MENEQGPVEIKIKYKRKRMILTFSMAMVWLIMGALSLVSGGQPNWIHYGYLFVSFLYFFQFFYNLKKQYLTLTEDSITKHALFSSKEIKWTKLDRIRKVAGDYKLYSADERMTIYIRLIDKDSLSKLEAVFEKNKP